MPWMRFQCDALKRAGIRNGLLLLLCWAWGLEAFATHNRAGEITYTHVSGFTYEVVITTYTKASAPADRPYLFLRWGDESAGAPMDSLARELPVQQLPGGTDVTTYRGTHTYPGPGPYEIEMEDPNRNEGVLNMLSSVETPFAIRTLLVINPQTGHNNSVKLLNPARENACLNQSWVHNPAAYDPDGDALTYSLVACRGFNGEFIPSFVFPDEVSPAGDLFFIDELTGDVQWETPQIVGEYNVAIKIEEWRDVGGQLIKVGEVIRDMQIDVQVCANQPPVIVPMADTCVLAGTELVFPVFASDPDGNPIVMTAVGGPMSEVTHEAQFEANTSGQGTFEWQPECAEIRAEPYQVVFKAEDWVPSVSLVDIETRNITVVSPPVEDLDIEPIGYSMWLSWSPHPCLDEIGSAMRNGGGHEVYRRAALDATDWTPALCEVGIPDDAGYEWVGTVEDLEEVGFVDDSPLDFGALYCYRVVTRYGDGALSLASDEVCAKVKKDLPVMTHASIQTTGPSDSVWVAWSPPTELDEVAFPGPYGYRLDISGAGLDWTTLEEFGPEEALLSLDSGTWVTMLNTDSLPWSFRVSLTSGEIEAGVSPSASTPWLELTPDDNQLSLDLNRNVPWQPDSFLVERQLDPEGAFDVLAMVSSLPYVDQGLVNNRSYCYRVTEFGSFDAPDIQAPLVNRSQIACGKPFDLTPPCPPTLTVDDQCEMLRDTLSWGRSPLCNDDDVMGFRVYWSPTTNDSLALWREFGVTDDSVAVFNEFDEYGSMAGCFVVTALDSLMPGPDGALRQNESLPSDTICVDNCPEFILPNVFTPNGDEWNEVFEPALWRAIARVDCQVFNRWGEMVYQTDDPALGWDGTYLGTGELLPDGVYFVALTEYRITLDGEVPFQRPWEVHLVNGRKLVTD